MARGNNDEIIRIVVNSVTDLVLARNSRVNWICRRRGRIAGLPDTGDEAKRRSRPKTLSRRTMHEAPCFEPSRTRDTLQPECEEANTGWQWEDLRQWNSEASTREGGVDLQGQAKLLPQIRRVERAKLLVALRPDNWTVLQDGGVVEFAEGWKWEKRRLMKALQRI
ncbi:hypothetical protein M430DRAFT_16306 [Amorphotheca resinae ATCC 22711]|uniref:Uncharacterized protein n=1 Tax=Amorphotheca resinae ATCC 22711 TaxID=857342 RepID=A0A2T3BB84_AMORE|nr:hypothetical protein M430DRAFT_16306 [Amorphotheca resinae ATCC 22711]PSS25593.1 hypothetical protein M430DRAFT_16306 [Amorphotheca resinae ATCC 22711]